MGGGAFKRPPPLSRRWKIQRPSRARVKQLSASIRTLRMRWLFPKLHLEPEVLIFFNSVGVIRPRERADGRGFGHLPPVGARVNGFSLLPRATEGDTYGTREALPPLSVRPSPAPRARRGATLLQFSSVAYTAVALAPGSQGRVGMCGACCGARD